MVERMTKEYIIGELLRVTQANEGNTVGRASFENGTGIRDYEWGRFWAKWNDLVRDAGLTPNKFETRLDNAFVLEKVALLAKRLGHFPSQAEMRLERIRDASFPSDRPLRRFGGKSDLLKAVATLCNERAELADLLESITILSDLKMPKRRLAENNSKTSEAAGYVYLVRSDDVFKIGLSTAPYRRVAEITNQSARGAELIHLIATDDPSGIEQYWHRRFAQKRIAGTNKQSGEWFELSADDVKAFRRRKSFM